MARDAPARLRGVAHFVVATRRMAEQDPRFPARDALVRELARLNQNLERLVAIAEKREAKPAEPAPVATAPEER